MKLSEELDKGCEGLNPNVIQLTDHTMLEHPETGHKYVFELEDKKDKFNCNAGVFNIYDERGACYVTTDEKFVKDLQVQHPELIKDGNIGVALSNGMGYDNPSLNGKWEAVKACGELNNKNYKEEQKNKAAKIAEMRGAAKTATTPAKQTEMSNEMLGKMASHTAER